LFFPKRDLPLQNYIPTHPCLTSLTPNKPKTHLPTHAANTHQSLYEQSQPHHALKLRNMIANATLTIFAGIAARELPGKTPVGAVNGE
jgi:hypothetical protein